MMQAILSGIATVTTFREASHARANLQHAQLIVENRLGRERIRGCFQKQLSVLNAITTVAQGASVLALVASIPPSSGSSIVSQAHRALQSVVHPPLLSLASLVVTHIANRVSGCMQDHGRFRWGG